MEPEFREGLKQTAKTLDISPGPWGWVQEYKVYVIQMNLLGIQTRQKFLTRCLRINKDLQNHPTKPQGLSRTVLSTLITFLIKENGAHKCVGLKHILWKICTRMDEKINKRWVKETMRQLEKIKITNTNVFLSEIFNINLMLTLNDSIPLLSFELEQIMEIISKDFFINSARETEQEECKPAAYQGPSTAKEEKKPAAYQGPSTAKEEKKPLASQGPSTAKEEKKPAAYQGPSTTAATSEDQVKHLEMWQENPPCITGGVDNCPLISTEDDEFIQIQEDDSVTSPCLNKETSAYTIKYNRNYKKNLLCSSAVS
jgi:hypothetical protein